MFFSENKPKTSNQNPASMKVLIFEDEGLTAERLTQLLRRYNPEIEVLDIIESVGKGVDWFENHKAPQLIFMDIQLTDGSCFELFDQVRVEAPVIFTTAYDEYAIKAFKINSIDYLLKPIDFKELSAAIDKFKKLHAKEQKVNPNTYDDLMLDYTTPYKIRFMVKIGDQLKYVNSKEIAYFVSSEGFVSLCTIKGKYLPLEYSLDNLEELLDPAYFFRINRKFIININSIEKIHSYFNSRLKLILKPLPETDVIISRERVASFKKWLNK